MKRALRLLIGGLILGLLLALYAYWEAGSDPRMRTFAVRAIGGAPFQRPIRIAFLSDTHMAGPENEWERLDRVVAQINAAKPDLVLLAGDYIADPKMFGGRTYSVGDSVKPFARFKAPLGVFAVLGNHDHWSNAERVAEALRKVGVTVLANQAIRRGPVVLGGLDDDYTRHADIKATVRAVRSAGGVPIYFTHSPDLAPGMPSNTLLLAGHTHCGQVALPLIGSPWTPSQFRNHYRCGKHMDNGRMVITTAGIGTTGVPFRFRAPPDWWLITVTDDGTDKRR